MLLRHEMLAEYLIKAVNLAHEMNISVIFNPAPAVNIPAGIINRCLRPEIRLMGFWQRFLPGKMA